MSDVISALHNAVRMREPTKATLRKYGLTSADWVWMACNQDWACFVCGQLPKSGRLHIDHDHVRGWSKMPPEERKRHVRGLLCFRCNTTYVGRSITVARAQRVVKYLQAFAEKRASNDNREE